MTTSDKTVTGLAKLREPFPAHQISKKPVPTKKDNPKGKCNECGGYHGLPAVHLDYVGHAALTDRLLDTDPNWHWEPLALTPEGLPLFDKSGGLWIRLTVCGVTRLGYGNAEPSSYKEVGSREKEVIGDCLSSGTLVTTNRGEIPIENIVIGDMALTRNGWKRVTDKWSSASKAKVLEVTFSNGSKIKGTSGHRIPTTNGVKILGSLVKGDSVWQDIENIKTQKIFYGMDKFLEGIQNTEIDIKQNTLWQQQPLENIFIAPFTKVCMDLYQRTITFIMSTITQITTKLEILLQSMEEGTLCFMEGLNTILPKLVLNVGNNLTLNSREQSGAPRGAKNVKDVEMGWPMLNQEKVRGEKKETVSIVNKIISQKDHGHDFALAYVSSVKCAETSEVWDLTIEDEHEFIANGIVVHNCIRNAAMRFGAALELWHKGDLHQEEIIQIKEPVKRDHLPPEVEALIKTLETGKSPEAIWKSSVPRCIRVALEVQKLTLTGFPIPNIVDSFLAYGINNKYLQV